jgi:DNA-binding transcriptional MocR family regulator
MRSPEAPCKGAYVEDQRVALPWGEPTEPRRAWLPNAAASVTAVRSPGDSASGLPELREAVAQRYTHLGARTTPR